MKKILIAGFTAGIVLLLISLGLMFLVIKIFPTLAEEYFSPVFRWSSVETDWMFYVHPFILSFSLKWFWERYKDVFKGSYLLRAFEVALVYGVVAMLPVLWLTYSSIDISLGMVATWLVYGIIQAFIAGIIFSKLNP
jgi:hypothetical protein